MSADRDEIVEKLRPALEREYARAKDDGWVYEMGGPKIVIVSETPTDTGLVVVWYGHYRLSFRAQSGSDWGTHTVTVTETTFGPDLQIARERAIGRKDLHLTESDEEGYEDDTQAAWAAGAIMKA